MQALLRAGASIRAIEPDKWRTQHTTGPHIYACDMELANGC